MSLKLNKKDFFEMFKGILFSIIISLLLVVILDRKSTRLNSSHS